MFIILVVIFSLYIIIIIFLCESTFYLWVYSLEQSKVPKHWSMFLVQTDYYYSQVTGLKNKTQTSADKKPWQLCC